MKTRRLRKRTLIGLIVVIDAVLVLIVMHIHRPPREDRVDIGKLRWLSSKRQLTDALEDLQDVWFSDVILRGEIAGTKMGGLGHLVDMILRRVNVEARMYLLIDPGKLRRIEQYVQPPLDPQRLGANLYSVYVERMAKELVKRIENGEIRYQSGSKQAKAHIRNVRTFVERHVCRRKDTEVVTLMSRMFPNIKVSFYTYVAMVLLNLRERIVGDFDLIRRSFENMKSVKRIRNEEIFTYARKLGMGRAVYRSVYDKSREYRCVVCDESSMEGPMDLLGEDGDKVICSNCFRDKFIYDEVDRFYIKLN